MGSLLTYEMVYQYLINPQTRDPIFKHIGCVVFDEAHLIGTPDRGPIVESCLYLLDQFYPGIQHLLLSASVGNPESFADHFHCVPSITVPAERPIPLKSEVCVVNAAGDEKETVFITEILQILDRHTQSETRPIPSSIIFCSGRKASQKLAELLNNADPRIQADFHHAGKTKADRQRIQNEFCRGKLNTICCTPTFAMGINTPADLVFITSIKRFNRLTNETVFLDPWEVQQRIGRAGRAGQTSLGYGQAYLFASDADQLKARQLLQESFMVGSQVPARLSYLLLTWVAAGILTKDQLLEFYHRIFLIRQQGVVSVDNEFFAKTLQWLLDKKFLRSRCSRNTIKTHA